MAAARSLECSETGSANPCPRLRAEGQRLSYCTDCEVVKGRASSRGFSVAQMQDAFERNNVAALLGDQHDYVICGTRFDPSAALWGAPGPGPPPVDVQQSAPDLHDDADAPAAVRCPATCLRLCVVLLPCEHRFAPR